MKHSWKETLRTVFSYTRAERRRILYLLPLLVVVSLVVASLGRPRFERSFPLLADARVDSARHAAGRGYAGKHTAREDGRSSPAVHTSARDRAPGGGPAGELFAFDPNTVTRDELVRLGFTARQAQGILNYRAAGKKFQEADDFADCYTVSDEMFARLRPYIRIARRPEAVRPAREGREVEEPSGDAADRLPADGADETAVPVTGAGGEDRPVPISGPTVAPGNTPGHADRKRGGGSRPKVELNGAGVAALDSVRGIGALTAARIAAYRERLGGFCGSSQLQEVEGMTERNYELICQQIWVDSSRIQKIDINFAPPEELLRHPYLAPQTVRKILKNRQLKGGWRTLGDMIDDRTVSQQQAAKLAPYLSFGPAAGR